MSSADKKIIQFNPAELTDIVHRMALLPIARMIGTKKIDPARIKSRKKLMSILESLGRTNDDAFEIHIEHIPITLTSIRKCIESNDQESAIILIYTLIEGEINTVIRMVLRIRGFSHSVISDSLRGIDLKSKIDLLLPVIGIAIPQRIRQLAFESQKIRNASIHFKALPSTWSDETNQEGDRACNQKKAIEFINRTPVQHIEESIVPFLDSCMWQCKEIQEAYNLLQRLKTT